MATVDQTIGLALELGRQGRANDGAALLRRRLQKEPANQAVAAALGQLLMQAGELEQALFQFQRCAAAAPTSPASHNNLGMILEHMGRSDEALAAFREAVRLDPTYATGWLGLSFSLLRRQDYAGAAEAARRALAINPGLGPAHHNLGLALTDAGQIEEGVAALREGLAAAPAHAPMRSTLLMGLNYRDSQPERLRAEHEEFGRVHGPTPGSRAARTSPDPDRKLHIGVLSSDLREQSVMYFFEPVLEHRDAAQFEYTLFASASRADGTTARLRRHAAWVDASMPDDAIVDRLIREHRIDILLDLGGHSGANRLTAMRDRPAPLIVTAIGYPNTTGMPAIGHRIVDSLTDPPGSERFATERLIRLDPCFLCYRPPEAPPVSAPSVAQTEW